MQILIIDDDPMTREFVATSIESRIPSVEMFFAVDGAEGLRLLDQMSPDIIVLDLSMPILSGFDFLRALQNDDYKGQIFVFSGCSELIDLVDESMQSDVYSKPADLSSMIQRIAAIKDAVA